MLYEYVKRMIDESITDNIDIFENALKHFSEGDDITQEDFEDALREECDYMFTYYSDAWDYLIENNITDFEDAMYEWNATGVCSIACYYLTQSVFEELGGNWDEYEVLQEEQDEDL